MKIILNGVPTQLPAGTKRLSYLHAVELSGLGFKTHWAVTVYGAGVERRSIWPGQTVVVKNGMTMEVK